MQIDWWTLGLQTVNFLVLVWLLWRFLYRPVKAVIEKRKQLTEQAFAEADEQKAEAAAARQRFEEDRAALAQEREDMLKKLHEELESERRKILEDGKREADKLLDAARQSIAEEREAALEEIRDQVSALAVELATGLLQRSGSNASARESLQRLEQQLKSMAADERDRLQKDLEPDNARLTVVTAVPLTPEERDEWRGRLDRSLGQTNKTDFATDAGILGGAELRFPHAVLKFTWADQLDKVKEQLRRDEAAS